MVVPIFQVIVNKEAPKLIFREPRLPWGDEELGHVFHIYPESGRESYLRLSFPVPDTHEWYNTEVSFESTVSVCGVDAPLLLCAFMAF